MHEVKEGEPRGPDNCFQIKRNLLCGDRIGFLILSREQNQNSWIDITSGRAEHKLGKKSQQLQQPLTEVSGSTQASSTLSIPQKADDYTWKRRDPGLGWDECHRVDLARGNLWLLYPFFKSTLT